MHTLYIHIGPHKTGSTYIQNFLNSNREQLKEHGINYPPGIWHAEIASYFSQAPEEFVHNVQSGRSSKGAINIKIDDEKFLKDTISSISEKTPKTIISYEGFINLKNSELATLRDFFLHSFKEIKIIFFWREPISFAKSELSQRARMGVDTNSIPLIIPYKDIIEKFSSTFGEKNIIANNFSAPKSNQGIIPDLIESIGLNYEKLQNLKPVESKKNESLSYESFRIAKSLKTLDKIDDRGNLFFDRYDSLLSKIKGGKIALTQEETKKIRAISAPHDDYILNKFGFSLSTREEPTPPNYSDDFFNSIANIIHELTSPKRQ